MTRFERWCPIVIVWNLSLSLGRTDTLSPCKRHLGLSSQPETSNKSAGTEWNICICILAPLEWWAAVCIILHDDTTEKSQFLFGFDYFISVVAFCLSHAFPRAFPMDWYLVEALADSKCYSLKILALISTSFRILCCNIVTHRCRFSRTTTAHTSI